MKRTEARERIPKGAWQSPDRCDREHSADSVKDEASADRDAKAALVARIDRRDGEIDEDVRRTELPVDYRALADAAARTHIAFDQRRQRTQRVLRIDGVFRHAVHVDIQLGPRADLHAVG